MSNLPPAYDILHRAGLRFITNARDYVEPCPRKCGGKVHVHIEDDGANVSWYCDACSFSRPPRATTNGGGTSRADEAEEQRRAFEDLRDEFRVDDGPAGNDEPADAQAQDAPADAPAQPGAEGAREAPPCSHIWRSKDHDYPCTPTGEEACWSDRRVYGQVIQQPDGTVSWVPKDELVTKADAAAELKPEPEPEQPQPETITIEEATALRRALVAAGYVPIPLYGKEPPIYGKNNQNKGLAGWQNITSVTDEMIVMWAKTWPDALNTGVLTRSMPTLDLDILNEEAARACEDLVREHYEEAGYVLTRIGKPPKRAIPFRTDEPFDKITVNLIAPNGSEGQKIELLADGQQVVVAGIHPDTQQPYRWHGGEPGKIAREELPYIREAEAQALVDDIAELLVRDFGFKRAPGRPAKSNGNGGDRAGGADWKYLLDNIHAGRELHDSLRDLAAKMIKSGMNAGAVVNALRALMEGSTVEHDARWRERYDDIPRVVKGAETLDKPQPQPKPKEPPRKLVLTLAEWAARDLPLPDFILGHWLTTTSRVLMTAPTGLGKTMLVMATGMAIAGGLDFLHWRGTRKARVLFIDGEMSRRLLKERLAAETMRLGLAPETFFALSHEDVEGMQPLNTLAGQQYIDGVIRGLGGVDLIIFDNIMALIAGDQKDEEGWRNTLPWVKALTQRNVGQIWVHHTGHDETRSYGTKTREWQMDTVLHLEKKDREDTDVSFQLNFRKARERTPATRDDFADVRIALSMINGRATRPAPAGGASPNRYRTSSSRRCATPPSATTPTRCSAARPQACSIGRPSASGAGCWRRISPTAGGRCSRGTSATSSAQIGLPATTLWRGCCLNPVSQRLGTSECFARPSETVPKHGM